MKKESGMYNIKDIQDILNCGKTKAYDLIRELNRERKEQGLIVVAGRIPVEFFNKRYFEESWIDSEFILNVPERFQTIKRPDY